MKGYLASNTQSPFRENLWRDRALNWVLWGIGILQCAFFALLPHLSSFTNCDSIALLLFVAGVGAVIYAGFSPFLHEDPFARSSARQDCSGENGRRVTTGLSIAIVFAFFSLVAGQIMLFPLHSAELYIVQQLYEARAHFRLNPIGATGDFPSRLMSWPAIPLFWLTNSGPVAIRLLGVFYLLANAALVSATVQLINPRATGVGALLVSLLSVWMLHLSLHGETNWIVALPFNVSAIIYTTVRSVRRADSRSVSLFIIAAALALQTLYLPVVTAIVALIMIVLAILHRRGGFSCLTSKMAAASVCWRIITGIFCATASTIGFVLPNLQNAFGRHIAFLSGGEEHNFSSAGEATYWYWTAANRIVALFWEASLTVQQDPKFLLFESSILIWALVGVAAIVWSRDWTTNIILWVNFACMFGALVVSNPLGSLYRTTVLAPFVQIFAAMGFECLARILGKARWSHAIVIALVGVHLGCFMTLRRVQEEKLTQIELWGADTLARSIGDHVEWALSRNGCVVCSDGYLQQLLLYRWYPFRRVYGTVAELESSEKTEGNCMSRVRAERLGQGTNGGLNSSESVHIFSPRGTPEATIESLP